MELFLRIEIAEEVCDNSVSVGVRGQFHERLHELSHAFGLSAPGGGKFRRRCALPPYLREASGSRNDSDRCLLFHSFDFYH